MTLDITTPMHTNASQHFATFPIYTHSRHYS